MGLPPKLFPDNFLRNSCSFFLSPKLLSSKLSNSYKILKIEEFALEDLLAEYREWIMNDLDFEEVMMLPYEAYTDKLDPNYLDDLI